MHNISMKLSILIPVRAKLLYPFRYETPCTGLSSLGVPGVPWHTQILADQLILFQPGGTDYVHLITTGTPGFSDVPTALLLSYVFRSILSWNTRLLGEKYLISFFAHKCSKFSWFFPSTPFSRVFLTVYQLSALPYH